MNTDETHLILIRHGQIQANVDKLWHGWTDSQLTSEGHQQAIKVAQRIAAEHNDITTIYASPLSRTQQTATQIASQLNLSVIAEPRIKEYGIGSLEGISFKDLRDEHDFFNKVAQDPHYAPAEGESIHQVGERVSLALQELAARHAGEKILAVSHGAAMALALAGLLHKDWYAWDQYYFLNTSVTEIVLGSNPRLVRFNCTQHLSDN